MGDDHHSRRCKHKRGNVLGNVQKAYSDKPLGKDMPYAKPCYSEGCVGNYHRHYTERMKCKDDGYLKDNLSDITPHIYIRAPGGNHKMLIHGVERHEGTAHA